MADKYKRIRFQNRLLRPLEKRDLINADGVDPEVLRAYGQLYFEAGRFSDALDFYLRAEDKEGLAGLKARALEVGDSFLLHRLEQSGLVEVGAEDWQALAQAAERLGKAVVAEAARSRTAPPPPAQPEDEPETAEPRQAKRKG